MKNFSFKTYDDKEVTAYLWEAESPKGIVQIIHGMAEHLGRYDEFARYLNGRGYIVCGVDHRAHGKSAGARDKVGIAEPGQFLFGDNLRDAIDFGESVKKKYGLPLLVLGHSYGSFLAQRYMQEGAGKAAGCVIMGSAYQKGALLTFGKLIAGMKKGKPQGEGKIFAKLTFESYDKAFKAGKNAWLTKEQSIVDAYNSDMYCNKTLSNAFYRSMFRGIAEIYRPENCAKIDKATPVFVVSGEDDGVGGKKGKLVTKLHGYFVGLGLNSTLKLYPNDRHEILNETDREAIYGDMAAFFDGCIA